MMLRSGIYFPKTSKFVETPYFVEPVLRVYHIVPMLPDSRKKLTPSIEDALIKHFKLAVPAELI